MTHDYKAALERLTASAYGIAIRDADEIDKDCAAITHAIRIAERVTGEPSDEMINSGRFIAFNIKDFLEADFSTKQGELTAVRKQIYKAMRDQMLKEIEEGK